MNSHGSRNRYESDKRTCKIRMKLSSSYLCIIWCLLTLTNTCRSSAFSSTPLGHTVSYSDHCSSIIPISSPAHGANQSHSSLPHIITSYFTGGDELFLEDASKKSRLIRYFSGKSLEFPRDSRFYETKTKGVYKVEAYLYLRSPYLHYKNVSRSSTNGGSHYNRKRTYRSSMLVAELRGFWSENSRKLCMVGSATWKKDETSDIKSDVVLKLNYASNKNPNMYSSVVSGTLHSINSAVGDFNYFEPVSIYSFPVFSNYSYSLVSEDLQGGFFGNSEVPKNQSLSLQPNRFCSTLSLGFSFFELEYAKECKDKAQNCSFFGGSNEFLPRFLSLYPLQCLEQGRKLRYLIRFQNISYAAIYQKFGVNSTLVGEASWDDSNNRLFIVACQIFDPENHFGNGVGDCTVRMSLRFPSVWNIKNDARLVGQIWSNETVDHLGYFRKIKLTSFYESARVFSSESVRYEYTKLENVSKLCPSRKKKGSTNKYPNGHSYDMRLDMSVKNAKGVKFAWVEAVPISVGNELYGRNRVVLGRLTKTKPKKTGEDTPQNISYKIIIIPVPGIKFGNWFRSFNWSVNPEGQVEITAEGVYDSETGTLCMVGCRKLISYVQRSTNDSTDCEILLNFQFSPLNDKRGSYIKGTLRSTRAKSDPLHFDDLGLSAAAFYQHAAKRSVWRMDMEIIMVLISNTFSCIFVGLQLFHLKRNPEVISSISLVMVLILSLGHMIPLLLNFDAMFFEKSNTQRLWLKTGGWLEANEVAVRVATMVAFLLQIRLLQLVWTSKASEGLWFEEKRALFVSLPMYILGGLVTLLLSRMRNRYAIPNYIWGDFRSYAGLILDVFLLPQTLLNAFRGSSDRALSAPFYIGTSTIRLVPHVYDQYRAYTYPKYHVRGTYYYANHTTDFYSAASDIMIPCGIITLATVIFLQQRYGGYCILPKRFRRLELYEKVPVVDNEK